MATSDPNRQNFSPISSTLSKRIAWALSFLAVLITLSSVAIPTLNWIKSVFDRPIRCGISVFDGNGMPRLDVYLLIAGEEYRLDDRGRTRLACELDGKQAVILENGSNRKIRTISLYLSSDEEYQILLRNKGTSSAIRRTSGL